MVAAHLSECPLSLVERVEGPICSDERGLHAAARLDPVRVERVAAGHRDVDRDVLG